MAHLVLLYTLADHKFARQLAVQLEQRGLVVWPVPEFLPDEVGLSASHEQGLGEASHALAILSPAASTDTALLTGCQQAFDQHTRTIVILCADAAIPDPLEKCPVVDFKSSFLLAFEELSDLLKKSHAPTRPLTIEHPLPLANPDLLPIMFPSERCWREDRLRVNYNLPIILTREELEVRLPAFLVACNFELTGSTKKRLIARRQNKKYGLFDPRRAEHILIVQRRQGCVRLHYQMTRTQVYHWFPAHYRMLDREAAALYRYLVTGKVGEVTAAVNIQARRARLVSLAAIILIVLLIAAVLVILSVA